MNEPIYGIWAVDENEWVKRGCDGLPMRGFRSVIEAYLKEMVARWEKPPAWEAREMPADILLESRLQEMRFRGFHGI